MKISKPWILGSIALSIGAFTACSSTNRTHQDLTSANYDGTLEATNSPNTGKNAMIKGTAPEVVNPADDTVERRNANHYTSRWNRPAVATNTTAEIAPAPVTHDEVTTTNSSADLGASSSGMGR